MKKRFCVWLWLFFYMLDINWEVWDSKICYLILFIFLKKVFYCDLIISNLKMFLVDSLEDGECYFFCLWWIGIFVIYLGIGNMFKWVGIVELSCFNMVYVFWKYMRIEGFLNRSRFKLWVCDRRLVVFMWSYVKDLCMWII